MRTRWIVVRPDGSDGWPEKTKREASDVADLYTRETGEEWTYRKETRPSRTIDLASKRDTTLVDLFAPLGKGSKS